MSCLFSRWFKTPSRRPIRRPSLGIETLEGRVVPALTALGNTLEIAVPQLLARAASDAPDAADRLAEAALGQDLAVVGNSAAAGLNLANHFRTPLLELNRLLQSSAIGTAVTPEVLTSRIHASGLLDATLVNGRIQIVYPLTVANPNVTSFAIGGAPGLAYFNGANPGQLSGTRSAPPTNPSPVPTATARVVFWVGTNGLALDTNQTSTLYQNVVVNFAGLNGKVGVGVLRDTDFSGGTATFRLTRAGFTMIDTDGGADYRLGLVAVTQPTATAAGRATITMPTAASFRADLSGSVSLAGSLTTHLRLGNESRSWDIPWTGSFSQTFATVSGVMGRTDATPSLTAPTLATTTAALRERLTSDVSTFVSSLPIFRWVDEALEKKLPVVDKSINDYLGTADEWSGGRLGAFTAWVSQTVNDAVDRIVGSASGLTDAKILQLIRGDSVDLFSWSKSDAANSNPPTDPNNSYQPNLGSYVTLTANDPYQLEVGDQWVAGDKRWEFNDNAGQVHESFRTRVAHASLYGVVSGNVYVSGQADIRYHWQIGFGVDSEGLYLTDETGVFGQVEVTGAIEGTVEVLDLVGKLFGPIEAAKVTGSATVQVDAHARIGGLGDNKLHLHEIARPNEPIGDVLENFVHAIDAGVRGDVTFNLVVDSLVGELANKSHREQLATFRHAPRDPAAFRGTAPVAFVSDVVNGTLTIDGNASRSDNGVAMDDRVELVRTAARTVVVRSRYTDADGNERVWDSAPKTGVTLVQFYGRGGNDSLTVSTGFDIPIEANGGTGDDSLQGGNAADTLRGDAGDDKLSGGAGSDTLEGGLNNDELRGGRGVDTLRGGQGNDVLSGEADGDFLYGGDDGDRLDGGAGIDRIYGEVGNDHLTGGTENDFLYGGSEDDTLEGNAGLDTLEGNAGFDYLDGGSEADTLRGGDDQDQIYGGTGGDFIYGDAGDDYLYGDGEGDTIEGGAGNDNIDGGAGVDTLWGDDRLDTVVGDDVIHGGSENDVLRGGRGDDWLEGGAGTDQLFGGLGEDTLEVTFDTATGALDTLDGGAGIANRVLIAGNELDEEIVLRRVTGVDRYEATRQGLTAAGVATGAITRISFTLPLTMQIVHIDAGAGNDAVRAEAGLIARVTLAGGDGDDRITGGSGEEVLIGGYGVDTLDGGAGNDILYGGDGVDTLAGGAGNDVLYGDDGDDRIDGGEGSDRSFGGVGHDTILAGAGYYGDAMYGGAGNDTMIGGNGVDLLFGEADNDTLLGGGLSDHLDGGQGADTLAGEGGRDVLLGGTENDVLFAAVDDGIRARLELPAVVPLTAAQRARQMADLTARETQLLRRQAELLAIPVAERTDAHWAELTEVENQIFLGNLAENDLLENADVVKERLDGGAGDDVLRGGSMADDLTGGAGSDQIIHSPGNDTVNGDGGEGVGGTDFYVIEGTATADYIVVSYDAATARVYASVAPPPGSGAAPIVADVATRVRVDHLGIERVMVVAGGGDDRVIVNQPRTQVGVYAFGGEGNDVLDASRTAGPNALMGDGGNDTLLGGADVDWLYGGLGNDVLDGGAAQDVLNGDGGDDEMRYSAGADYYFGGEGTDRIVVAGVFMANNGFSVRGGGVYQGATRLGFAGGTVERLEMIGGSGNDTFESDGSMVRTSAGTPLIGGFLSRLVFHGGGTGRDTFITTAGATPPAGFTTEMVGGFGTDTFRLAGRGTHTVTGGSGTNELIVEGDDLANSFTARNEPLWLAVSGAVTVNATGISRLTIDGRGGNDTLDATLANIPVTLLGGAGNDTLYGSSLADVLFGGEGDDVLWGRGGNDSLHGERGFDRLYGEAGDDTLDGGWDGVSDYLFGGSGADTFWIHDYHESAYYSRPDWAYDAFADDEILWGESLDPGNVL